MIKNKHYNEIIAFAEGMTIQYYDHSMEDWADCYGAPQWSERTLYRVKPERKENSVRIVGLYEPDGYEWNYLGQFCVISDGDTKKVISIEVLE